MGVVAVVSSSESIKWNMPKKVAKKRTRKSAKTKMPLYLAEVLDREPWQRIACEMLGVDSIDDIPKNVYFALRSTADYVEGVGGVLVSRQVIASVLATTAD